MTNGKDNLVKPRKIRIAYVIDHFFRGGGTENQLANLIDHLDRERFEPIVFNTRPFWHEVETAQPCPVIYLKVRSLFSWRALTAFFKLWRHLRRERVDIVQVYFFDSRLLGTLAGKLAGVGRIVFCRRDMGWWHTRLRKATIRSLAAVSHYCLVNARVVKDMVVGTERFPRERIEVIYNGLRFGPPPGATPITRGDLDIPEHVPIVGMVGNLRPVKRYDRLVRIAAAMSNRQAHFVVVGRGQLLESIRAQAAEAGVIDRFHFLHLVGVYHLLRLFDIGVLTSESEGLSNVLIEYALAGKPAVAFDVGGNREVVLDGETGFVVPDGDEEQMAARLDYLLETPHLCEQYGARAQQTAPSRFDLEAMVGKTEQFYERIVR